MPGPGWAPGGWAVSLCLVLVWACATWAAPLSFVVLQPELVNGTAVPAYWHVRADHVFPEVSQNETYRFSDSNGRDCLDHARDLPEPDTEQYWPRNSTQSVGPWPLGAPKAFFRWEGRISKAEFDSTPTMLRNSTNCLHCRLTIRYKLLDRQLYVQERPAEWLAHQYHPKVLRAEEMIMVAAYLFPIPDVDFILHFGDGSPSGWPTISWSIDRYSPKAGFTMPTYSTWTNALGPQQLHVLAKCLQARYPQQGRIPRVVWRGRTSDENVYPATTANLFDIKRVRLHLMARWHPQLLDTQLTGVHPLKADPVSAGALRRSLGLAQHMPMEAYNSYAGIVDVNGNGWSDRFAQLALYNTPVLKQASRLTAWFEHLFAPGVSIAQVDHELENLLPVARAVVADGALGRVKMAQNAQGVAHQVLNQVRIAEAMAYSLTVYAAKLDWQPVFDSSYTLLPRSLCCHYASLPREAIERIRNT